MSKDMLIKKADNQHEQQSADKPKNILLAYCWGNDNVGDKVITPGMLNLLQESFPMSKITVISLFSNTHPEFQKSAAYIKGKYPNITFMPNLSLFSHFSIKHVSGFLNLIAIFFSLLFPRFYSQIFPDNIGLKALVVSDIVISNCGHIFFWNKRMKSAMYTFIRAYPLIMAKRLRIPYGFYAQSFGPFEFDLFEGVVKIFFKWLFSGSCFIYTRESASLSTVNNLGAKIDGYLEKVPDAAFSFRDEDDPKSKIILNKYNLEPNRFIAMTLRLTKRGSAENLEKEFYESYSNKLQDFIARWVEDKKIPVLFVCQQPHDVEDSMFIYEHLPDKYKKYCIVMTEKLSPEALRSLYKNARILIGMRFHSLIFALSESTPVMGLYYYDIGPKILGMMGDMGFQDYVFNIDDVSGENLFKRANELDQNRNDVSKEIEQKLAYFKEQGLNAMKEIKGKVSN
jgi:colanic acid/amylovoran biosynthesis protein